MIDKNTRLINVRNYLSLLVKLVFKYDAEKGGETTIESD